jgi:hypothetical protein
MGLHEDRINSIRRTYPEHHPVSVGILPATWIKYRGELDTLVRRYSELFPQPPASERDYDAVSGTYVQGSHVDAWGCVWQNLHHGMQAIVTGHPLPSRADVHDLQEPEEDIGLPHGFMFLRLTDLRGFEEMMVDFAEEPPELEMLIDTVLSYNLRQARRQLERMGEPPQIAYFGDDLGMQQSLPMSPDTWRKYLKPCYEAIYRPFKDAGHLVYMHSDGHILEIIPDLVDCGVDVINPQYRANPLPELRRVTHGSVCVDLDLDRQLFPFCTPAEVRAHVAEAVDTLGAPEGGLWLKAEIGEDVPLENVEAIFQSLLDYRNAAPGRPGSA